MIHLKYDVPIIILLNFMYIMMDNKNLLGIENLNGNLKKKIF